MTEAQQLQAPPMSDNQKLQNGAEEEIQIFIKSPLQPRNPACSENRKSRPRHLPSCNLRSLAIVSIICGVSCVGIKALILALQAEQEGDQEMRGTLSRRSRRFSVLSILLFVGILVSLPFLLVLVSYLMTLIE
ncbi:transmembrane protein 265 [Anomaloglossus baeobatrachus]|uniref:transmembrane protein 265 n=1 Tax=Anomaloglossus baeobatrachus TaxID=238106 RepID=UPI003F4F71BE